MGEVFFEERIIFKRAKFYQKLIALAWLSMSVQVVQVATDYELAKIKCNLLINMEIEH